MMEFTGSWPPPKTSHDKLAIQRQIEDMDGTYRQAGVRIVWADRRGNRDCGGSEQIKVFDESL